MTISGYTILNQMYESTDSLVYQAIREQDNTAVVMKVLKEDYPAQRHISKYTHEYHTIRSLSQRIQERFNIPVVYLTAYADEDTVRRAKVTKPFGYLIKPFDDKELHSTIEIALYNRQMEQKLIESERKYHTIFDEARDGIVLIDKESGYVVDCNPEFEKQTGRKIEQLKKMKIWEVRPPEKVEVAKRKFSEIKEKGMGGSSELEFQKPGGERTFIEFSSHAVSVGGRQILQSICRDITERKKMEEEILKKNEELEPPRSGYYAIVEMNHVCGSA